MDNLIFLFLPIFAAFSFLVLLLGIYFSSKQKSFQETKFLGLMGVFVWGDAPLIALFWFAASLLVFFLRDLYLFFLIVSVFWAVRSLGEVIYWINQQFSALKRNPPEKLFGYSFFKNESIWFVYQLYWQIVLVVSIIFSIYFACLWLRSLS